LGGGTVKSGLASREIYKPGQQFKKKKARNNLSPWESKRWGKGLEKSRQEDETLGEGPCE